MLDNSQRLLVLYHLQVMLFTFSTFFSRQPLRSFLTEDGMDLLIGVALNVSKDSALQDNLSCTLVCICLA